MPEWPRRPARVASTVRSACERVCVQGAVARYIPRAVARSMAAHPGMAPSEYGPWNPGIESQVPEHLRHLCTIFRPENVFTSLDHARELCDLTGLELADVTAFRPQRLALHELLVRVTADFSVPDGPRIEDLGINFRKIVSFIFSDYVEPEMEGIIAASETIRREISQVIDSE